MKYAFSNYRALVVTETDAGKYTQEVKSLHYSNLPNNEVVVKVHYSSLNYKDALSAVGNKGVTKTYPHTPGIDAAGEVVYSKDPVFHIGDKVIVSGYDLGMNTSGGFAEYICVPGKWIVKLPENLTLKETMIIGTAGFTAAISIHRLIELVKPDDGKIVVTGATGGVGSVAVNILTKLGYSVTAVTGKTTETNYLKNIGATEIISRTEFLELENRPILSANYAGGIDTVGGKPLENMIKSVSSLGAVTTCGSVASTELNLSVFPFILRGISLIGLSAQNYPMEFRKQIWQKLASEWKPTALLDIYKEISLEQLPESINKILQGKLRGRVVIKLKNNI